MRNGLIRPLPNWPQQQLAAAPIRSGIRIPNRLIGILVLLIVASAARLTRSPYGWMAVALAYFVVRQVGAHWRSEGRSVVQVLAEYTVVGALVFAVMIAMPTPTDPPKAKRPAARHKPPAEAGQSDPWADLRNQLPKGLRDRLPEELPRVEFTTTKEAR